MEKYVQDRAAEAQTAAAENIKGKASRTPEERRRRNKRFNTVLYCVAGALVLLGVFIILRSETMLFTPNSAEMPDVTFPPEDTGIIADASAEPMPTDSPEGTPRATYDPSVTEEPPPPQASEPVRIFFEGYGIACRVQSVGVSDDGSMETIPSANVAGWYRYAAAPGQPGNCIIAGHNRYAGQKGSFSLLHSGLTVGDRVGLELADGSYLFYRVISIDTYDYNSVPAGIMANEGSERLTLITCLGDFDYNLQMSRSRVVAVCIPVN